MSISIYVYSMYIYIYMWVVCNIYIRDEQMYICADITWCCTFESSLGSYHLSSKEIYLHNARSCFITEN